MHSRYCGSARAAAPPTAVCTDPAAFSSALSSGTDCCFHSRGGRSLTLLWAAPHPSGLARPARGPQHPHLMPTRCLRPCGRSEISQCSAAGGVNGQHHAAVIIHSDSIPFPRPGLAPALGTALCTSSAQPAMQSSTARCRHAAVCCRIAAAACVWSSSALPPLFRTFPHPISAGSGTGAPAPHSPTTAGLCRAAASRSPWQGAVRREQRESFGAGAAASALLHCSDATSGSKGAASPQKHPQARRGDRAHSKRTPQSLSLFETASAARMAAPQPWTSALPPPRAARARPCREAPCSSDDRAELGLCLCSTSSRCRPHQTESSFPRPARADHRPRQDPSAAPGHGAALCPARPAPGSPFPIRARRGGVGAAPRAGGRLRAAPRQARTRFREPRAPARPYGLRGPSRQNGALGIREAVSRNRDGAASCPFPDARGRRVWSRRRSQSPPNGARL